MAESCGRGCARVRCHVPMGSGHWKHRYSLDGRDDCVEVAVAKEGRGKKVAMKFWRIRRIVVERTDAGYGTDYGHDCDAYILEFWAR